MNVGIYIYDNAEVLDFSGPFEVFSTASRLSSPKGIFNVFLIAESKTPVIARGGYSVNPNFEISEHPELDVVIVSGGLHVEELNKPVVIDWVASVSKTAKVVASVCTGAFILAQAGLLSGLRATTHWEDIPDLEKTFPDVTVVEAIRWIDEGHVVTSAGISAGIDMSLHLVSRLVAPKLAEMTARQMEFDWMRG